MGGGRRRDYGLPVCHGRSQFADVGLAVTGVGRIQGLGLRVVADLGAYLMSTTAEIPPLTLEMATGPYAIRNVEAELVEVYTTKVPTGAYRGAGRPEATFYLERAIDLLARTLGLDPALVRRRNFIPPEAFPYRAPSGALYDSGDYARALDRALEVSAYSQWRERQAKARQAGRHLGIDHSSHVETCTYGSDASRVELDAQGRVTVLSGTSPHGQGGATGFAQLVADALGLEVQQISVVTGDTARIPDGDGTAGSRTMVVGGSAVYRAAQRLRQLLAERAARRLEASAKDLVFAGGGGFFCGGATRRGAVAGPGGGRRQTLAARGPC